MNLRPISRNRHVQPLSRRALYSPLDPLRTWMFIIELLPQQITSTSTTNIILNSQHNFDLQPLQVGYGGKGEMMGIRISGWESLCPYHCSVDPADVAVKTRLSLPTFNGFRFNLACSFYTGILVDHRWTRTWTCLAISTINTTFHELFFKLNVNCLKCMITICWNKLMGLLNKMDELVGLIYGKLPVTYIG